MSHRHDTEAPPIIVERLTARYNGDRALEGISFQIQAGQRVAVVGPNGAGKTTLFRVIAGIMRPTEGSLSIHGHAPGSHICVGYVPQRALVDTDFPVTVKEVVMMGRVREIGLFRWPSPKDWRKVEAALDRVGLTADRDRAFGEISAGQQQRAFLAQAAAQAAQIVLLDEPLSGVDVPSQEAIFKILDGLQADGITVLVATHDLNLAAERFDRVMLLNRRLISFGDPEQAFTQSALQAAYGRHLHVLDHTEGLAILADTHHEGRE
jgi:manganese/iron transport system ATP-binding protein